MENDTVEITTNSKATIYYLGNNEKMKKRSRGYYRILSEGGKIEKKKLCQDADRERRTEYMKNYYHKKFDELFN